MNHKEKQAIEVWGSAFRNYQGEKEKWNIYVTKAVDNLHTHGHPRVAAYVMRECFFDLSRHDG